MRRRGLGRLDPRRRGDRGRRTAPRPSCAWWAWRGASTWPPASCPTASAGLLEIGVALAGEPELLLLDEPTSGLGSRPMETLRALVQQLAERLTIVVIEHDMDFVLSLSHHVAVLHRGTVIAEGPPAAIRDHAEVREAYLGTLRHARGGDGGADGVAPPRPRRRLHVLRRRAHPRRAVARHRGGGDGVPAGPQRPRQDHHHQDHPRAGPGAGGAHRLRRRGHHQGADPSHRPARHRLGARQPARVTPPSAWSETSRWR